MAKNWSDLNCLPLTRENKFRIFMTKAAFKNKMKKKEKKTLFTNKLDLYLS